MGFKLLMNSCKTTNIFVESYRSCKALNKSMCSYTFGKYVSTVKYFPCYHTSRFYSNISQPEKLENTEKHHKMDKLPKTKLPDLNELLRNEIIRESDIKPALMKGDPNYISSKSLLLLECFYKVCDVSPLKRVFLAENLFRSLRSKKAVINESHYLGLLKCYKKSGYFTNMIVLLSVMKSDGVNPSDEIQLMLLKCMSENGKPSEVISYAEELKNKGLDQNEALYSSLIYSYAINGKIEKAMEEFKKVEEKNFTAGEQVYTSLLRGLIPKGDVELLKTVCAEALDKNIKFSEDSISSILHTIAKSGQFQVLEAVMKLWDVEHFESAVPKLLIELIHSNNIPSANELLSNCITLSSSFTLTDATLFVNKIYRRFIDELIGINYPLNDLLSICKELRKFDKCTLILEYVLYKYLFLKNIKSSIDLFEAMLAAGIELKPHYFWPLISIFSEKFGDEGIVRIMKKLAEWKIYMNTDTLLRCVFPKLKENIEVKRLSSEYCSIRLLLESYAIHLLRKGHFTKCFNILQNPKYFRESDIMFIKDELELAITKNPIYPAIGKLLKLSNILDPGTLISNLWTKGKKKKIQELLQCLKDEDIPIRNSDSIQLFLGLPDVPHEIKDKIKDILVEDLPKSSAEMKLRKSFIERCLKIENEEIHLAELEAKDMNTKGHLLRLLKSYLHVNMYGRALKIRDRLMDEFDRNLEISSGYLYHFCDLAVYEKDLDNFLELYKKLCSLPVVHFDVPKALDTIAFLIESGRFEESKKVIFQMKQWHGSTQNLEVNCIRMLKTVSDTKNIRLVRSIFNYLLKKGILRINENTLRVFTTTYIKMNDLDGAVNEYTNLVKKFDISSNDYYLTTALVEGNRFDLLDEILQFKNDTNYKFYCIAEVAKTGNVDLTLSYSKKLNSPLDNSLFRKRNFIWLNFTLTSFKTLIAAAKEVGCSYDHFVNLAIKSLILATDTPIEEFLQYAADENIAMPYRDMQKLKRIVELQMYFK